MLLNQIISASWGIILPVGFRPCVRQLLAANHGCDCGRIHSSVDVTVPVLGQHSLDPIRWLTCQVMT